LRGWVRIVLGLYRHDRLVGEGFSVADLVTERCPSQFHGLRAELRVGIVGSAQTWSAFELEA
jgi:hypothetical protein